MKVTELIEILNKSQKDAEILIEYKDSNQWYYRNHIKTIFNKEKDYVTILCKPMDNLKEIENEDD